MQKKAGETCRGQTVQAGLISHGEDCGPFQNNGKTVDVLFHLFIWPCPTACGSSLTRD